MVALGGRHGDLSLLLPEEGKEDVDHHTDMANSEEEYAPDKIGP